MLHMSVLCKSKLPGALHFFDSAEKIELVVNSWLGVELLETPQGFTIKFFVSGVYIVIYIDSHEYLEIVVRQF